MVISVPPLGWIRYSRVHAPSWGSNDLWLTCFLPNRSMWGFLALIDHAKRRWSKWCIGFNRVSTPTSLGRVHHHWLQHFLRRWYLEQILWCLFKFSTCIASVEILNILKVRISCHSMLPLYRRISWQEKVGSRVVAASWLIYLSRIARRLSRAHHRLRLVWLCIEFNHVDLTCCVSALPSSPLVVWGIEVVSVHGRC